MFGTRYHYAATRGIGGRRWRAALLASSALALAWTLPATPSRAQDATWLTNPGSGDFFDANNWSPGSVPTGTATFGASATTTLTLGTVGSIGGLTLNAGASAYTFDVTANQTFTGAGIVINGGSATINFNAGTNNFFEGSSTAGSAAITSGGTIQTTNTGSLGNATITNNGYLYLQDSGTAGSATITNNQLVYFYYSSTAGTGTIVNNNSLNFSQDSNAGSAHITNAAASEFNIAHNSTLANATVINSGQMAFWGSGPGNLPSAGNATITNNAGGTIEFSNASTAGSATITNSGTLSFNNASSAGGATIISSGSLGFSHTGTAGNANVTNNNNLVFFLTSTAGNANITNNSLLSFFDTSTAGSAALVNNAGGTLDFSNSTGPNGDGKLSAGSIAGAGSYLLGANELTVGPNNLSTEVGGVISGSGSLVKIGTGILTLSGVNAYSGSTAVDGGTLAVNGSILSSSGVTVNAGGTIGGTGTVGNTTITSGGNLAAGNSIGTLSINGNLTFNAGGIYTVEVSPSAADRTNVAGAATLTGATVQAVPLMPASFKAQTYTILNASGGLGGTEFAGLDVIGSFRPGARNPHLNYDANSVYLVLDPGEIILPSGTNGNQSSVAAGINRAVLGGATPPAAFDVLLNLDGALLKNALTQISGETAVGAQQSAFNAANMFMAQMTDPFNAGRSDAAASGDTSSFAAEADAYAASRSGRASEAYGAIVKAMPPTRFEQRWSVWAGAYGGTQTTDGNAVTGTGTATSRIYGGVGGADYRLSSDTVVGFALAGGGTNFSVANGGSGRADLFQAGAFARYNPGAFYLAGALAYGWQDVTTDRTVTVAGIDRLQARFNANTYAGRVEAGYRFATPWMNLTPYAAGQVTSFELPAYAESVLSGANTFALSYGAKTVTASRSELGLRTDRSWTLNNAILTLRGRAAWAHDFNPDRAAAATFQTLPGASFVVDGAAQARDSVLATASAEMTWRNGFSLGATFEGEFSNVTRSFAGKGIVRYVW